jgi:hypothetical protein
MHCIVHSRAHFARLGIPQATKLQQDFKQQWFVNGDAQLQESFKIQGECSAESTPIVIATAIATAIAPAIATAIATVIATAIATAIAISLQHYATIPILPCHTHCTILTMRQTNTTARLASPFRSSCPPPVVRSSTRPSATSS